MEQNKSETNGSAESENGAAEATNGAEAQAQNDAQTQIEALQKEVKDQQNKYMYLYAEFETYKKRAIKERSDLLKFGHENFAREVLQVSDNLDRALQHTENTEALITGLKMVNQQMHDTLNRFGISSVSSVGKKFDPEFHEAVSEEASSTENASGNVVREHQKGFTLHGRLLRPARVVVAK